MAQSVILASGSTNAAATDITILPGGPAVSVYIYAASGVLPPNCVADLYQKTPGTAVLLTQLTTGAPVTAIASPGVYSVVRREGPTFAVGLEQ